jgi:hypothetical protein
MNQLYGKEGLSHTNKWFLEAMSIVTQQNPWWNRTLAGPGGRSLCSLIRQREDVSINTATRPVWMIHTPVY